MSSVSVEGTRLAVALMTASESEAIALVTERYDEREVTLEDFQVLAFALGQLGAMLREFREVPGVGKVIADLAQKMAMDAAREEAAGG